MTASTARKGQHRRPHSLTMKSLRGDRHTHGRQDLPIEEIAAEVCLEDGGLGPASGPTSRESELDVEAFPTWQLMAYGLAMFAGLTLVCTAVLAWILLSLLPWG